MNKIERALNKGSLSKPNFLTRNLSMAIGTIVDQKVSGDVYLVKLTDGNGVPFGDPKGEGWIPLTTPIEHIKILYGGKLNPNKHKIVIFFHGFDLTNCTSFVIDAPGKNTGIANANLVKYNGPMWALAGGV